jgi:hypothetical protein
MNADGGGPNETIKYSIEKNIVSSIDVGGNIEIKQTIIDGSKMKAQRIR